MSYIFIYIVSYLLLINICDIDSEFECAIKRICYISINNINELSIECSLDHVKSFFDKMVLGGCYVD